MKKRLPALLIAGSVLFGSAAPASADAYQFATIGCSAFGYIPLAGIIAAGLCAASVLGYREAMQEPKITPKPYSTYCKGTAFGHYTSCR